ncbi:hypothetical protein BKA67DRAFT_632884 [Truncatella angustata]|uniref:Rhodopsin domain-containing protein n=1 Tax=Truncatella angustata TaxID=152316 RepID=A0A9P8UB09_9PEZI|nr:uncharacterized protein BKA67DRAFT_632884 [Truncatella angustata]KAH6643425.1 hypothetical protein BKA67DRAFT_632884 [Truncatella angustata]
MNVENFSDDSLRFSPILENDHAGYLWIVTILGLIYGTMSTALRAHIKWRLYGPDDYCIAVATVPHFIQSAFVLYGLNHGLAKFNSDSNPEEWLLSGKSFLTSEILSVLILGLAKCSIIALMLRIFATEKWNNWAACVAPLVLCVLWCIGSIIALSINCDSDTLLTTDNPRRCPAQFERWRGITITDIVTEILIFLLPIALMWPLNMTMKRKFQVSLAFSFRFIVVIFSALHLAHFNEYPSSAQPQFAVTKTLLFQQTMVAWALISATIPNLKAFMRSFSMGMGFAQGFGDSTNDSHSYPLQSLSNRSTARSQRHMRAPRQHDDQGRDEDHDGGPVLRPDIANHFSAITHRERSVEHDDDTHSIGKSSSQELIITRKVQWGIEYE